MKTYGALILAGALVFVCLVLIVGPRSAVVTAAGAEMKDKGLLESKDKIVASYNDSVARIVSVLANKKIRESDRPTTVAAIELAGTLRAKEAVPHLVNLLLYGKKGDIKDLMDIGRIPPPPDSASPAVQALIDIGVPSLEPVCKKLVSTSKPTKNKSTLRLHCVWVIWKILGTDLGMEYLLLCQKKYPEAKEVFDDVRGFFEGKKKRLRTDARTK